MLPTALIAFLTAALMLLRAAGQEPLSLAFGLTAAAFGLCLAGAMLVNRAGVALMTCPRISEEGVGAGRGLALGLRGRELGEMLRFLLDYVIEYPDNNRRELLLSLAQGTED